VTAGRPESGPERSGETRARPQERAEVRIAASADVDQGAKIGAGTAVWHLAQVREDAVLGRDCVIGRGAYIGTGVRLGDDVKVQNYALVYEPAEVGDGRARWTRTAGRSGPATGRPSASPSARAPRSGRARSAWHR
jgi:acyl-[acyl carrier protein]--UDP-N-acetylglucosamine O-acyltransferase